MYSLPTSIKIGDNNFTIRNNGDFRMVLDCFKALSDTTLSDRERVISSLIIFYANLNSVADVINLGDYFEDAIMKMYDFFNCGDPQIGEHANHKLIDWEQDSTMICAAINNVCGKEIRVEPYVHWWTFMGYYMSIGESLLSTVVGIRDKIAKHKKLEKWEKEYKRNNPQYFMLDNRSNQSKEDEDYIRQLWG